ncbi:MAG: helix-turn-helix transcriptional regulator [Magnetococcales bacterium]|nr:helix-turn-helix transcriptional regulator [Magnetococcales bacterium]
MNHNHEFKNQAFAQRFKSARLHADLTQQELAGRVGISQAAIHKLESGQFGSSRKTVAIAMACRVNPVWLETGAGEMLPQQEKGVEVDAADGAVSGGTSAQLGMVEGELDKMIHNLYALRNQVRRLRNRQRARARRRKEESSDQNEPASLECAGALHPDDPTEMPASGA